MTDEQSPEILEVPAQPAAPALPVPPSEQQPALPFNQLTPCQYPGCTRQMTNLDQFGFRDPETGAVYCKNHVESCYSCGTQQHIKLLVRINTEDGLEWVCKACYTDKFTKCPNCKKIVTKEEILPPTSSNRWSMKQGGCTICSYNCSSCDRVVDKDQSYSFGDELYCEDCHSEHFRMCDGCNSDFEQDELTYVEENGEYCNKCYKETFAQCEKCEETIDKSYAEEGPNDTYYCESCAKNFRGPIFYGKYTEDFHDFSYTKKDRFLTPLYKLLPISVKELKTKHPSIARGLGDLISMSGGKDLTRELVDEYRGELSPEEFPVTFTEWDSDLQRSISKLDKEQRPNTHSQLVLQILPSFQMSDNFKKKPVLYDLFDKVNNISQRSTHPYAKDQVGWVRLELDPKGEYILVDEIQSDHSNSFHQLKSYHDFSKLKSRVQEKYKIPDNTNELDTALIREDIQQDPDIETLRSKYKKRYNRTDEELNELIKAKLVRFDREEDALLKHNANTPDELSALLVNPVLKEEGAIRALRAVYKVFGNFDDEKLDDFIKSKKRPPYAPSIWDGADDESIELVDNLKEKYNLDDAGLDNLFSQYSAVTKDFPNIASQAVTKFAQENGFKKIFWHTYESGMKLKDNEPPKSLYDQVPKDNLFQPSENRPFGLEGKFFEREAKKAHNMYKLARKLYLKHLAQ